jgi:hypothetical protein
MVPAVERVAALGEDMPGLQQAHREMNAAMHAEWDLLTGLGPLHGVDPCITGDVLARVP